MTEPRWARVLAVLIVVLFVGLGCLWIAWPGLECDEARFVLATFPHKGPPPPVAYTMSIKGRPIALMVVSYMGALKGWLYIPILKVWPGSVAAIRVPMVLVAAVGLYLFYLFTRGALGWQAGLVALALAATDPIYLFTTRLDWGPVAIQHFCLLAGCFFVLRWWRRKRPRDLALGFFIFGVGIFDKATFLWLLEALALSTAIVFPRQLWRSIRPSPVAVAAGALLLGSAPFLYYCWKWPGETFRQELGQPHNYSEKVRTFKYMLQGTPLVGWISRDPEGPPMNPPDAMARIAYSVAPHEPLAETLFLPAAALIFLLFPAVRFSPWGRGMLFALSFSVLAFLPMMLLRNAGWVQHVSLVLPFPQLFVAAGVVGAKERVFPRLGKTIWRRVATGILWLVVLLLTAANLRAVAHHYFRILGYGGGMNWSEAIYSLEQSLEKRRGEKIFTLDWGMSTQLRLLSSDRLPVDDAVFSADGGLNNVDEYVSKPTVLYVKYAPGEPAMFPQTSEAFFKLAARRGYEGETLEIIRDRRGRPIYEILSLRPQTGSRSPQNASRKLTLIPADPRRW